MIDRPLSVNRVIPPTSTHHHHQHGHHLEPARQRKWAHLPARMRHEQIRYGGRRRHDGCCTCDHTPRQCKPVWRQAAVRAAQSGACREQAGVAGFAQCDNITYCAGSNMFVAPRPFPESDLAAPPGLDHLGIGLAGLCAVHCLATAAAGVGARAWRANFLLERE